MNTVLYVEDEALQAESTKRLYEMCERCFHGEVRFLVATSMQDGLRQIRAGGIDVVVLDLTLPPLNRTETLAAISKEEGLPPIIVFTGHEGDETLRTKSILAGADDFMFKSEMHRHPEILCERVYIAYLRRNRKRLNEENNGPAA